MTVFFADGVRGLAADLGAGAAFLTDFAIQNTSYKSE
jgi:hypothetical protein